ncbi:putative bifunctional diguanylate cyclase/phosphodiesterase [Paraburkholderia lycopersici]|uniref:PAS domain S-box-containing protein/diguanylate cyclase (GGDEF) domain-containing protein n=1 Tax=Paraburkholderia lycopersici TaxID=416944 RepID=A0A1G6M6V4_9BURK|nr:EAL domain-containing protein [Paraburkholderia lycopersici]SDC50716.1 PAS domain S-box-containing protein/diguanylate cyclase (GGDEF) domain-containing protein [Paraburkholderia lycopersici]
MVYSEAAGACGAAGSRGGQSGVSKETDGADEALASERSVLRLVSRSMPLPELLAEVCCRAERLFGEGVTCAILRLDSDGRRLRIGSAPSLPAQYHAAFDGTPVGAGTSPSGTAIFERRTICVEDYERAHEWGEYRRIALESGLRAVWTTPLDDGNGGLLGVLAVYQSRPWRPTAAEEALLRDIAHSVAAMLNQQTIAERLAQSEEHHRLVVDHLNEGIVMQSRADTVLACNRSARRLLRLPEDAIGRSITGLIPRVLDENGTPLPTAKRPSMRALETGKPVIGETVGLELADGEIVWVRENVLPIFRSGEREAISVVVSFTDIGPVREAQQQLRYLATRDALTGLYNRTFLAERMHALLETASCSARPALLFVDLDGFKKVNDTGGHEAGDMLLRDVGQRLAGCVGEADTLARVGGDEFVIAVCCYADVNELIALAQRVLDAVGAPFAVAGNEYYLGASIGISLYPDDGRSAAALMRNADSAMYAAKQRGSNQFQFFTTELRQRLQRRFQIERGLRRALGAGELYLVYQPIVDGASGRMIGAEALLRWKSEELGEVSPVEFIPVAEDTGMILPIGQWVLEHACRQAAQWRRLLAPAFVMAVNFSPRQIAEGLVEQVESCLANTGLAPEALEVEITEGILMSDSQSVQPVLRALNDIGVRISVDDFGTGYSSLSYLKRFPLHHLKVDRTFVAGLPGNRDSVAITQAVVAMAHSLGMRVTAEGVETPEQASFLRSLACERQQGYLFGRPVSAQACAALLREHAAGRVQEGV